ncbi:MAG: 4-(cytidine 5'-diphospho)-2-C-methyl-D-erythritol kinase, partial [Verrucomicrobia bacterium]
MATTIQTPAKVNLLLNVLGKRPDGFHELETILLPVPLYDSLEFDFGGADQTLECDQPGVPTGESNLVLRAARLFAEAAHVNACFHARLVKAIPAEAGLGGGSSDAAATLLALNREFERPLDEAALRELA